MWESDILKKKYFLQLFYKAIQYFSSSLHFIRFFFVCLHFFRFFTFLIRNQLSYFQYSRPSWMKKKSVKNRVENSTQTVMQLNDVGGAHYTSVSQVFLWANFWQLENGRQWNAIRKEARTKRIIKTMIFSFTFVKIECIEESKKKWQPVRTMANKSSFCVDPFFVEYFCFGPNLLHKWAILSIFQQIDEKKTKSLQNTTIANKWRSETNPNQSYTSGLACWCIVSIDGRTKQSKKLRWCWKLIRSRFPLCRMVIAESRHRQVSVFGCDCHNAFIYLKQFGIWVEHQKNSRRIKTLPK